MENQRVHENLPGVSLEDRARLLELENRVFERHSDDPYYARELGRNKVKLAQLKGYFAMISGLFPEIGLHKKPVKAFQPYEQCKIVIGHQLVGDFKNNLNAYDGLHKLGFSPSILAGLGGEKFHPNSARYQMLLAVSDTIWAIDSNDEGIRALRGGASDDHSEKIGRTFARALIVPASYINSWERVPFELHYPPFFKNYCPYGTVSGERISESAQPVRITSLDEFFSGSAKPGMANQLRDAVSELPYFRERQSLQVTIK